MKIKNRSRFKNQQKAQQWFEDWVSQLEQRNKRKYERIKVPTSLGETHIWGLNTVNAEAETLIIFPGARTTVLFWDLDNGLDQLAANYRIFLVETNGLPNLSHGDSPDIRSLDYGKWAAELFDALNLDAAFIAGASFGGLICMKLAISSPARVKAAFLLNPGCLQPFSLSLKNLYYNLLPIMAPSTKNISQFLDKAVFCKPEHALSRESEQLLIDYELFALKEFEDNTQKPYYMRDELKAVKTDTYLYVGDKDLLFPYEASIQNALLKIKTLRDVIVYKNVAHGIETYKPALAAIDAQIRKVTRQIVLPVAR